MGKIRTCAKSDYMFQRTAKPRLLKVMVWCMVSEVRWAWKPFAMVQLLNSGQWKCWDNPAEDGGTYISCIGDTAVAAVEEVIRARWNVDIGSYYDFKRRRYVREA